MASPFIQAGGVRRRPKPKSTPGRAYVRPARSTLVVAFVLTTALGGATVAQAAPNDPLYSKQWGLQQVRAEQAWARSDGTGVVIGIVDSGVDLYHPDLANKMLPGNTFLGCGNAGCGNGDWQSGPSQRRMYDSPHGTHVAGIAGAVAGNGIGIAGVAPGAKLLPVKVLDENGGSFADIALGIRYATDQGAKVINLSLGSLPGVQVLTFTGVIKDVTDAIAYANGKGVVVVAAAGNDSVPLCDTPGFDPGALCVAATDRREGHSFYSNFGLKPDLLAVSAPGGSSLPICGEDIVSTVPAGTGATYCGYPSTKDYDEYAGTSMAAPHVAGVAALLVGQGRSRASTLNAITSTARTPGTNLRGVYNPVYGYGIVDAAAAVAR
ncbi:MAG: S8 family serine peptidase [Actinobacteria bacterium]|nr:S8 family serine peptidase [Actinomycetota bacterium]